MNQTQLVKGAIKAFIIVAVCISLFQELKNSSSHNLNTNSSPNSSTSTQSIKSQLTGPKIQGVRIFSSEKFNAPIKQILVKNNYNVEITQYQFQGNDYYINLICSWGHMILIYVLMNKYKTQTNESTKKKLMIGGAIAVIVWFYLSGVIKPQRFSIQIQGRKQIDRDYLDEKEIIDVLSVYQFQFDDQNEINKLKANIINTNIQPKDAWSSAAENKQKINSGSFSQKSNSQNYQQDDPIF